MSREKTTEEVREAFLAHIRNLCFNWSRQEGSKRQILEGLAFSILVTLDGCGPLPGWFLAVKPHPDDKEFHIEEGDDYYPEELKNIAGNLHERFYPKE